MSKLGPCRPAPVETHSQSTLRGPASCTSPRERPIPHECTTKTGLSVLVHPTISQPRTRTRTSQAASARSQSDADQPAGSPGSSRRVPEGEKRGRGVQTPAYLAIAWPACSVGQGHGRTETALRVRTPSADASCWATAAKQRNRVVRGPRDRRRRGRRILGACRCRESSAYARGVTYVFADVLLHIITRLATSRGRMVVPPRGPLAPARIVPRGHARSAPSVHAGSACNRSDGDQTQPDTWRDRAS
jgi:hypothetical protein